MLSSGQDNGIIGRRGGVFQVNRNLLAFEFADRASEIQQAENLTARFSRLIAEFGFTCFCAGRVASEERRMLGGAVWAQTSHKWHDHWAERRYAKLDPAVWFWRLHPHRHFASWSEVRQRSC